MLIAILLLIFYRALRHGVDNHSTEHMGLIASGFFLSLIDVGTPFLDVTKQIYMMSVLVYIVIFAAFTGRGKRADRS